MWCKKDALVVYRGSNYQSSSRDVWRRHSGLGGGHRTSSLETNYNNAGLQVNSTGEGMMDRKDGEDETVSIDGSLYEREADRLLSGLGPRYVDWWRPKPLPVDADLLPEVVPGFKPPFRLCPPKASSKLKDDELTYLRNLSRPLPTHFVLGTFLPSDKIINVPCILVSVYVLDGLALNSVAHGRNICARVAYMRCMLVDGEFFLSSSHTQL